jgi:hypothetical protein
MNPEQMTSLRIYLDYLEAKRKWQESYLKSKGMTFAKLEQTRNEATSEMVSLGQDKIELDGYVATLEQHPIRIAPDTGKVIGHSYHISLHTRR